MLSPFSSYPFALNAEEAEINRLKHLPSVVLKELGSLRIDDFCTTTPLDCVTCLLRMPIWTLAGVEPKSTTLVRTICRRLRNNRTWGYYSGREGTELSSGSWLAFFFFFFFFSCRDRPKIRQRPSYMTKWRVTYEMADTRQMTKNKTMAFIKRNISQILNEYIKSFLSRPDNIRTWTVMTENVSKVCILIHAHDRHKIW